MYVAINIIIYYKRIKKYIFPVVSLYLQSSAEMNNIKINPDSVLTYEYIQKINNFLQKLKKA